MSTTPKIIKSGTKLIEAKIDWRSVAYITLNRPEKRNAFNGEMNDGFLTVCDKIGSFDTARVVVIGGNGPLFCAGGDVPEMTAPKDRKEKLTENRTMARVLAGVYDLPQPVIAAVHGAALGGGTGLVAASNYAIMMADTKLKLSEVNLGLVPANIMPYLVSKIGCEQFNTLASMGFPFTAEEALRIGLAHEIVPMPNNKPGPDAEDTEKIEYQTAVKDSLSIATERAVNFCLHASPDAQTRLRNLLGEVSGLLEQGVRPSDPRIQKVTAEGITDAGLSPEGQKGAEYLRLAKTIRTGTAADPRDWTYKAEPAQ